VLIGRAVKLKMKNGLCIALLSFCPLALGANCPKGQPRDGSALLPLEHIWAKALEAHDQDALLCILADEFEDANIHRDLHSRGEMLARAPQRKSSTNELSELSPHVQGDFGFVRGLDKVTDPRGKIVAQVGFTDIFAYRDRRWVAVAGQETLLTDPSR
jgi:hypothetical protein